MEEFKSFEEKEFFVRNIFDRIAKRYDVMNTILSFNQDKRWRRIAVEQLGLKGGDKMLDVACGTCALTIEAFRKEPYLEATVLDFSSAMLSVAKKILQEKGLEKKVTLQKGDAMTLPYADDTFDSAIIGFALRNVPDIKQVLKEMHRVVKKGGKVVTLELAKPSTPGFKQLYYTYFEKILPLLGSFGITGETYSWLPESLKRYPHQREILKLFGNIGFKSPICLELTGGIVAVHVGMV